MCPVEPLSDFVLVDIETPKPYNEYRQYPHLILPEKFEHGPEDRAVFATVLKLGPECQGIVKPGDRVIFGKWKAAKANIQETTHAMVREFDILAVDV